MEQQNYLHGKNGQKLAQHHYSGYDRSLSYPGWREEAGLQSKGHQPQSQRRNPPHQNAHALPPGWVEATDSNSGKTYYCNPETRETKWERPIGIITNTAVTEIAAPQSTSSLVTTGDWSSHCQRQKRQQNFLPPGWVEAVDQSSGKSYFCNPQTRETRWEHPASIPSATSVMRAENNGYKDSYGNIIHNKGEHSNSYSGTFISTNITHQQSDQSISPSVTTTTTGRNNYSDDANFDELGSMRGGQIAHLIKVQQRQECEMKMNEVEAQKNKHPSTYVPLHISLISSISTTERTEPGRLDVRMYALRGELKKFGYAQASAQEPHPMHFKPCNDD
mmetsp:Transcript_26578/g.62446  ORF Transcript_26578/g.62446 Transcript_26578/m.62446 type:complete len:333 (+) Transcript_26578:56-1054(+)